MQSTIQPQTKIKKYENSTSSKTNSPLAFAARSFSHRTGPGYHRRVDSGASPRNSLMRACQRNAVAGPLSVRLARLDVPGSSAYGWFLHMNVRGDSDVYVIRNTWPVGAHSGWHTHPGPSMITVTSGELTVYEADNCTTPTVYHAGESFTDLGCGDVHLIRNEGTVCAVNVVVQIVPAGQPRRIDADQPANCPAFTCSSPTPCPQ